MNVILTLLPLFLVFAVGNVCDLSTKYDKKTVKNAPMPPSWVFKVIWPILLLLLGLCWAQHRQSVLIPCIVLLFVAWPYARCSKNILLSRVILVTSLVLTSYMLSSCRNLLVPQTLWLSYASLL